MQESDIPNVTAMQQVSPVNEGRLRDFIADVTVDDHAPYDRRAAASQGEGS